MSGFNEWWGALSVLNQWFFGAAAFFSVFFVWQLFSAMIGLGGGDGDLDTHAEPNWQHHSPNDAQDTVAAFKLFSVRSIIAFFTLFTWAGALYLQRQERPSVAVTFATLWGVAAMVLVSLIFHLLKRLTETGTMQIAQCVGSAGTVYLDIAARGEGEVRVMCGGVMTHFKARTADGSMAKAGTPIRVTKVLSPNSIEVTASATPAEQGTNT
jgi:membrane protein implicated in regulation of membrane protease activity